MLLPKYKGFSQERQIGEYTILLPDPPDLKLIGNKDLPKEKQKFYPVKLPKDILSWDAKSRGEFEANEWHKRMSGYWFWNNGNLEWVTGTNYFYINWWSIDIGLPSFIDSDRDWYYMWWYVQNNPKARGFINLENRRGGKTWKGTCCLYESTSRTPNSQSGIQSKTDADASKVFKKLVFSWKKVPYFFKPVDAGESNPKSQLEFIEPSKRNTKVQKKEYGLVLDSLIDFESSGEEAYDGTKQLVNYQDEIGKTKKINVNERIKIVRECVVDGSDIIGKIIGTSTVEEMEKKGGKYCKMVWDGADPSPDKLLPNGETQNGLLRYFKPSDYGYRGKDAHGVPFVDEWGYSDRPRTKAYIEANIEALKKREDKNSYRRKYPLSIRDCFISDSKKSVYDTDKIEQQLFHNESLLEGTLIRGDFKWKNGEVDTEVFWHPNENGKWLISSLPPIELRNKKTLKFNQKAPGNTDRYVFGLDPYDQNTTVDDRKSDAASYGLRKFDPLDPDNTGIFVSEYVNRPPLADIMFEDMIMQCVFFGAEILIESNKVGCINHFTRRGYSNYLMMRPEETHTVDSKKMKEPGIPMSGSEARQALVYAVEAFVINKVGLIEEEGREPYMGKCYFNKLLNDLREFDFETDWTKFDSMVGAGLALLAARKYIPKKKPREIIKLFDTYDTRGTLGRRIE
jgi:hypothetical protein